MDSGTKVGALWGAIKLSHGEICMAINSSSKLPEQPVAHPDILAAKNHGFCCEMFLAVCHTAYRSLLSLAAPVWEAATNIFHDGSQPIGRYGWVTGCSNNLV